MDTNTVPQTIEKTLSVLSEKFGTTIQHLWAVLVRQAVIEGIFNLVVVIVLLGTIPFMVRWAKWLIKEEADSQWIGWCIVALIQFIFLACSAYAALSLLNPEYYALKQILP